MTRSEFAAGLNAAIERVNELVRLVVWSCPVMIWQHCDEEEFAADLASCGAE